ncbi:HD domain-containing protein [Streptosporangium lutulentum]
MSAELMDRWRSLTGPDAEHLGRELIARYGEPHRRYHTTAHLEAVLAHVDTLAEHAENPDLVRLAAWFHDAVYDPRRGDNEERSATLAERVLPELGLPAEAVATVARLVRLTVTHDPAAATRTGPCCATPTWRSWPPRPGSTPPTRRPCARNTPSCRTTPSEPAGPPCCAPCSTFRRSSASPIWRRRRGPTSTLSLSNCEWVFTRIKHRDLICL